MSTSSEWNSSCLVIWYVMYMLCKWKVSDGQQFRLHQQNELSPLILNKDHDIRCWKSSPWLGSANPDCYICSVLSEWSYHILFLKYRPQMFVFIKKKKIVLVWCICFRLYIIRVRVMVPNTTFTIPSVPNCFGGYNDKYLHITLVNVRFNNISVKPWQSLIVLTKTTSTLRSPSVPLIGRCK
jgi:hypothetical protein